MSRANQSPDFTLKVGGTAPPIEIQVLTGLREVVDITGATSPEFHMWKRRTREVIVDATAEITSASTGTLAYGWEPEDTAEAGLYEAEFQFTLASGEGTVTIPNDGYYLIEILPAIA